MGSLAVPWRGSGRVTEDLVFALDARGMLVDVPFVDIDLSGMLEVGRARTGGE